MSPLEIVGIAIIGILGSMAIVLQTLTGAITARG